MELPVRIARGGEEGTKTTSAPFQIVL